MYNYETQKPFLFTDAGQRCFLKVRDHAARCLDMSGAVRCQELLSAADVGDSWNQLACGDRLLELGELKEVTGPNCVCQYRVFVRAREE